MKKKNLIILLMTLAMFAVGTPVYGAEFTSDETVLFNDGSIELEENSFGDVEAAQETSAPGVPLSDVPLCEENFPNQYFRDFLKTKDLNRNGILEATEITEIKEITRANYSAPVAYTELSMYGYQYLTSLEKLDLHIKEEENPDKCITLDFSTLPALKSLSVSTDYTVGIHEYSTPADVYLSENTQLTELTINCAVSVNALPKDCNIKEYTYRCQDDPEHGTPHSHSANDQNMIAMIQKMPKLETVTIKNIPNIILNTSFNPELRKLTIVGSDSSSRLALDVTSNKKLTDLNLNGCTLENYTLDLSDCTALETLNLEYLSLASAPKNGLAFLDIKKCHAENVNVRYGINSRAYMQPSGYLLLKECPNWNPERIKSVDSFHVENGKLYPHIDNFNKGSYTAGSINYYLDEDKTILADCNFFMYDVYCPEIVTGLKVTKKSSTSLTCQWNPVKRAHTGYALYIQNSRTGETLKKIYVGKSTTSKTITGLKPGGRYQLVVRAFNKNNGKNYYSAHYQGNILTYVLPKTPAPKAQNVSGRKVKLTWKKTPATFRYGRSQYILYCRNAGSKTYRELARVSDTTESFTTKALKKNNTYYFKIRSVIADKDGRHKTYGGYSKEVKVKITK